MNRACKYVRMHNKIAAQEYAKSARARARDGHVIYFIEMFASCNQTARLKRRGLSKVKPPSLITFKLKLRYV